MLYEQRGDKYTSYVTEVGVADATEVYRKGRYGLFVERMEAATPVDAMRAWSVIEDNALTLVKPGVWLARYDLVTVAMRAYALVQQRPRQSAIKKAAHVQQQRLLEGA